MYIPSTFREIDIGAMHELMRSHPLALLVTTGATGLQASPVPFLIYADEGEHGTLRAHLARANPHWKELNGEAECLVVFQGPEGYITPSWYPSKATSHKAVPTWNYATVHAWGKPVLMDDAAWLARQVNDLTSLHEMSRVQPWKVSDAPADYIAAQMKAIVGIEIQIGRIEGKWKMSQNKDGGDRRGVIDGMRSISDSHYNPVVANLVERSLSRRSG